MIVSVDYCMYANVYGYLGLDENGGVAVDGACEPGLEALGKVPDGLRECAWNWPEDVGDEKIYDALVEEVVTGTDVVCDEVQTGQEEEFLFG